MFVHFKERRLGPHPSRRVGCSHRGQGRRSIRPYLVRNYRDPVTNKVTKEYVHPLASTVRTCCLVWDFCRRCWFWVEVERELGTLRAMARRGELDERFAGVTPRDWVAMKRKIAARVPYPTRSEWSRYEYRCSLGWVPTPNFYRSR